jgi:hypothetical protein
LLTSGNGPKYPTAHLPSMPPMAYPGIFDVGNP